jgi:predicted N-acetyltransferase YhbS
MRLSATSLTTTAAMIEDGHVMVAQDQHANLVGVVAVQKLDGDGNFDLAQLYVEPRVIRMGIGRALFEAAVALVASQGGSHIAILSDPFAESFYIRLGALRTDDAPSDAIPGRRLPRLEYTISSLRK